MFDQDIGWAISGYDGTLYHTLDGGETWSQVTPSGVDHLSGTGFMNGHEAWGFASLVAQPNSPAGTLYHTADGGKSWQALTTPFQEGTIQILDAKNLAVAADMGAAAGNLYFRMYRTSDAGQTWDLMHIKNPYGFNEVLPTSMPDGTIHVISGDSFMFQNPSTVWFGGGGIAASKFADLYASRDAGQTWQHLKLPLPGQKPDSGAPVVVDLPTFFTDQDGIFAARYEGQTNQSANTFNLNYLATYVTQDGGRTWSVNPGIAQGLDNWDRVDFISPEDAFVPCGDNLCATHDGGKTWQTISSNIHFLSGQDRILGAWDFVDARTGWAAINQPDNSTKLYETVDGGASWSLLQARVISGNK